MAEPTFAYGYTGNPQGSGQRLTWAQLMTKATVNKLHPEVQRRLHALLDAAAAQGVLLGVGTGWRVQPTGKPGFAKPGNSYHEGFQSVGNTQAMAIDTVPNTGWNWLEANCKRFGFRTFRHVNNEPWHIQPSEIPASRNRATSPPPLQRFNLPGKPTPPPPPSGVPDVPRPTLKLGSTGQEVKELVNQLKFWRWYPSEFMSDVNDGKFGNRTDTGVRNMQRALKITVDGVYGTATARSLTDFLVAMSKL